MLREMSMLMLGVATALPACSSSQATSTEEHEAAFGLVTQAQWRALAGRTVFFGHQSVGRNIMAGVRDIAALDPQVSLRVVTTDDLAWVPGPAFVEASLGRNGDPRGKTRAFVEALDRGLPHGSPAIVVHKYCYADISADTDVEALFANYRAAMDHVRRKHPDAVIVHMTTALTANMDPRWRRVAQRLLGRGPDASDPNVNRNRFNRLLLAEYGGREPVFDLARIQSTDPRGDRVFFSLGEDTVFTLAPEWTYDGGHLNEAARRQVAERFLAFLATLSAERPAPP